MLRVRVLGPMRVEFEGQAVQPPASRRAWSLLAYLALHPGPASARGCGRSVLARCSRRECSPEPAQRDLGAASVARRSRFGDRDELALDAGQDVWVDALEVERLLAAGRSEDALALGAGELLAGFDDEWAMQARAAHRDRVTRALEALAAKAERDGDHETAIRLTRREVGLDRFDEAAHRRLMTRLAAAGDRSAALSEYELLRERLRRELSVAPAPVTRELADELRHLRSRHLAVRRCPRRSGRSRSSGGSASCASSGTRGREHARARVAWLLTGEAGIGKTRLAVELLAQVAGRGARTASCAALDLAGAAPFGLWAELIGELGDQLEFTPA